MLPMFICLQLKKKKKTNNIVANAFEINHNHQLGKKMATLFGSTITTFFGSINPYKHGDEARQWFLKDLVLYIYKGYKPLSTCERIQLQRLVSLMFSCQFSFSFKYKLILKFFDFIIIFLLKKSNQYCNLKHYMILYENYLTQAVSIYTTLQIKCNTTLWNMCCLK